MAISIAQLVDAISQIEIQGIKVRDMDEIKAAVLERDCPILIPEPLNFISNIVVIRDSAGVPSYARKTVNYQLNYTFLFAPVGSGRELEKYGEMVKGAFRIFDALISQDTIGSGTTWDSVVEIWPVAINEFGPVPDPSGGQFIGCRFQILVTEFVN